MTKITKEAIEALKPFADAVFNDNGDMTVDLSFAKSEDFIKAYFVHKRLSTLPIAGEGKVKALEWEPHFYAKTDELVSLTADLPGREWAYKIEPVTANVNFRLFIEGREIRNEATVYWPLSEAKAAAQADFESRISAALSVQPAAAVVGEPEGWKLVPLQANWHALENLRELMEQETTFEVVSDAYRYVIDALPSYEPDEGAAPSAPDGWQPIETAPRDGREILVVIGGAVCIVWWGNAAYNRKAKDYDRGWTTGGSHGFKPLIGARFPLRQPLEASHD